MDTLLINPRAVIGDNAPPEPTPLERAAEEIGDLYSEAVLWLDGAAVTTQEQADGLSNLLNMLRAAEKRADAARKAEKQPHMDAAKAVDEQYKPLLTKTQLATDGCKKALAPWLEKLEAEKRAAAERARQEAEEKARVAQEAIRAAEATNLEAREAAEALLKDAKKAATVANRASRETATAGGAVGRAVGLRTIYRAEVIDPIAFGRHCWAEHNGEYLEFLSGIAERLVRLGKRDLPGVAIHEEKVAV